MIKKKIFRHKVGLGAYKKHPHSFNRIIQSCPEIDTETYRKYALGTIRH